MEIASVVCLPVLFRGAMHMKVFGWRNERLEKEDDKSRSLILLYVPKTPVTLVIAKPKALFAYCNISTPFQ